MKKNIYRVCFTLALILGTSCDNREELNEQNNVSTSVNNEFIKKGCGTHSTYLKMLENKPELAKKAKEFEDFTNKIAKSSAINKSDSKILIPVIVHVVYNTAEENIKWRQVKSQIDALNRDFNKENDDISGVPGFYRNRIANVGIKFELKRITRTKTNVTQFVDDTSTPNSDEKFDIASKSRGGKNGSDNTKYLNIWVGNFGNGFAGFALIPALAKELPKFDGVYIDYRFMGSTDVATQFDGLGRTATHEVGHWLNLLHLSGLKPTCRDDDGVSDTPRQNTEYLGVAPYPESRTCNTPDMTMNFMQSVVDSSLLMFTNGQKERMLANFATGGIRESFNN